MPDRWDALRTVLDGGFDPHIPAPRRVDLLAKFDALRREWDAWMNGVADAVEHYGYNREAACGPADLLPGLRDLVAERDALAELVRYVHSEIDSTAPQHPIWYLADDAVDIRPAQADLIERITRENP